MSTEIKTGWDLKMALEKIIEQIDERSGLFSSIEKEEKRATDAFALSLAGRRDDISNALTAHYIAMEREVYPLLDKVEALRKKLAPVDLTAFGKAIPNVWNLSQAVELVETMERLSAIPEIAWERLGQLAAISTKNHHE